MTKVTKNCQKQQKKKAYQKKKDVKKVKISRGEIKSTSSTTNTTSVECKVGDHISGLSELQSKFHAKIQGARFRTINEKLYSQRGEESFREFQSNPSLFETYHSGYREQVKLWPENPLHIIINWIKTKHPRSIISDMGCGEAVLARSLPNRVHSFDLVSKNSHVVACDIAHVPLANDSVDIVVFCLSLMGTNIGEFLVEASRILKPDGILKIAEVRSRFEGDDSGGLSKFLKILKRAGFDITEKIFDNRMFFLLECVKTSRAPRIDHEFSAKACIYKKR